MAVSSTFQQSVYNLILKKHFSLDTHIDISIIVIDRQFGAKRRYVRFAIFLFFLFHLMKYLIIVSNNSNRYEYGQSNVAWQTGRSTSKNNILCSVEFVYLMFCFYVRVVREISTNEMLRVFSLRLEQRVANF